LGGFAAPKTFLYRAASAERSQRGTKEIVVQELRPPNLSLGQAPIENKTSGWRSNEQGVICSDSRSLNRHPLTD
jgi:hypothetical protein